MSVSKPLFKSYLPCMPLKIFVSMWMCVLSKRWICEIICVPLCGVSLFMIVYNKAILCGLFCPLCLMSFSLVGVLWQCVCMCLLIMTAWDPYCSAVWQTSGGGSHCDSVGEMLSDSKANTSWHHVLLACRKSTSTRWETEEECSRTPSDLRYTQEHPCQ